MPLSVLTIDPQNELKFNVDFAGMFEQGCTTYLRLANPTTDKVLFKIKTTAPKKYCVRPNSGSLEPNSKVEIAITPQPVYIEANEKHKHKFMVQTVIAPEGNTNVDQVWKEIGSDQLMDYKLKCVFETPREANMPMPHDDAGDVATHYDSTKKRVAVNDDAKPAAKEAVEILTNSDVKRLQAGDVSSGSLSAKMNLTFPKSENVDIDLQKASLEVVHLREEESKLRHENLQLKEELLRLRQSMGDGRVARSHSFGPEKQGRKRRGSTSSNPMPWIGIAIVMALLGVIIGKFFM